MAVYKFFPTNNKKENGKLIPVYKYETNGGRKGGLLKSDVLHFMYNLAKCQLIISSAFVVYGAIKPWYSATKSYRDMCTVGSVAGALGLITGFVGFAAMCRVRWRCVMIVYLIFAILSAVAYLLVLIYASVWLGYFGNLPNQLQYVMYISIAILLMSVAIGVCYILTSVFICTLWVQQNEKSYRLLGNIKISDNEIIDGIDNDTSIYFQVEQAHFETNQNVT